MKFAAVAIGRNEGERLKHCVKSISAAAVVIYVDSGSIDGSADWALGQGAEVLRLDSKAPFTAARARNAGFKRLRELAPDIEFVQFIDGDCELFEDWPEAALSFLNEHADVAAVYGRLRERYAERSIYNWLCDKEWDGPIGDVRACGGVVMMRTAALIGVGGFRDDLIAGEEPELCVRLRGAGQHIWRLDTEMALHDAGITHITQWWRRSKRAGYAFAQGAYLHGALPEKFMVWESRRALLWGVYLPLTCFLAVVVVGPLGWFGWLVYPFQILRQTIRNSGPPKQRVLLAFFQVMARFPEAVGLLQFLRDRLLGWQSPIIEHK